jgi:hypothetical protein
LSEDKRYLFICGAARSGTSALWRYVTRHPDVALGLERYLKRSRSPEFLGPELFTKQRFFEPEEGDTFYMDLERFHPYYAKLRARFDTCAVTGDKIPRLYEHYPELNTAFDKPKVLFIVRNVFDVAASYNRRAAAGKNWPRRRDYSVAVRDWNRSVTSTLRYFDDSDIFVVEYETFFAGRGDPGELFAFIEVPWKAKLQAGYDGLVTKGERLEAERSDGLTSLEKRHLCRQANFHAYRKLLEKARSAGRLLTDLRDSVDTSKQATSSRPTASPAYVSEQPEQP